MARLQKLSDDNIKFIEDIIYGNGVDNYMEFELIGLSKSKTLSRVSLTNATTEYLTSKPQRVCIYIYEEAFDMLNDDQKKMLIEDILMGVKYDFDSDKIKLGCPSINISCEGRAKYGDDLINAAEAAVLAIQQIEDEERQRKEEKKYKKGTKV